ncbi:MAG: hypothetical protein HY351_01875 [Candidatus Omnitrophica bacterium]|nr:hypothetical protein [Candidatus Omnitrophota bacterium]
MTQAAQALETSEQIPEDQIKTNEIDQFVETIWKEGEDSPNHPKLSMEPLKLNTESGKPNAAFVLFVALAVVAVGALGFFLWREFSLRRETVLQLTEARSQQVRLDQTVSELKAEVASQKEEIDRLISDLSAAMTKAALVDTMRSAHEAEITRIKGIYENQTASLRGVTELKNELVKTLQTELRALRSIFERDVVTVPVAARTNEPNFAQGSGIAAFSGFKPPSGKVLSVDHDNRFLIINIGPAGGARLDGLVQIHHKGNPVGEGRIDRTYQNLSAVSILSNDVLEHVEVGDQVFLAIE